MLASNFSYFLKLFVFSNFGEFIIQAHHSCISVALNKN